MSLKTSQDGRHRVSDVSLDLGDLLLLLLVREGRLLVQDPHLLHQRRLARLSCPEQQQPVCRAVHLERWIIIIFWTMATNMFSIFIPLVLQVVLSVLHLDVGQTT